MRASYGCNVVFTLMNSFSTSADTKEFLAKQHSDLMAEPYIELMQVGALETGAAKGVCMHPLVQPIMVWRCEFRHRGGGACGRSGDTMVEGQHAHH